MAAAAAAVRAVIHFLSEKPSRQQWQAILRGVAASNNLTKLLLAADCRSSDEDDEGEDLDGTWNTPCGKLAGLTNLKDLTLHGGSERLMPGDVPALTALTGLTGLRLWAVGAAVGDETATALANSCQQLRHLDLSYCHLSIACLASVAHLTQLTGLRLLGNIGLTQQGLMLLTGLKRLQDLGVDRNTEVTSEVVESFWAVVRQQQQQL
ncbi:hypothetical protein COO60DRAFT_882322 [Scenedesmus sp. NREL 46B-D3]|nr:hypothetical protein COO60DRAFT_882322 [Scenedesmus sp. NREL 46B-D3]